MQHQLNLTTVICNVCGFVFTNPVPLEDLYNRFYTEAYADYYSNIAGSAPVGAPTKEPQDIGVILDEIQSLRDLRSSRLLEVGPGRGRFLYWASQRGATVLGVEPSVDFYNSLQESRLNCINTTLESLSVTDIGKFDIITMFHVLEHFYDPNRVLQKCRDLLADGDMLVVIVPNILKPFRSLDRYFLRYVHLSSFSPDTLKAMLEKHGFAIDVLGTQGKEWRSPRNIFVISRKLASMPTSVCLPSQTAEEVENILIAYRRWWKWVGAPRWHLWWRSRNVRRLPRRIVHFAKRKLTKG